MCSRTSGTSNRSVLGWHVAEEGDAYKAYHHCIVQQVCSLQFSQVAHSSKLPNVSLPEQPTLDRLLFACAQAKAPCKVSKSKTHQKTTSCSWFPELNPQNGVYTIVYSKLANCLSSTSRWFLDQTWSRSHQQLPCRAQCQWQSPRKHDPSHLWKVTWVSLKNVKNLSFSDLYLFEKQKK